MKEQLQNRIFVFLERLWGVAALLAVVCVVYFLVQKDNDSAVFFFGFFILASILYLLRKRQRVRHQKFLDFQESEKQKKSGLKSS